jgi:hypothetical protein
MIQRVLANTDETLVMSCVKEAVLKALQAWPFFQPEHLKVKDSSPADLLHIAETFLCGTVVL